MDLEEKQRLQRVHVHNVRLKDKDYYIVLRKTENNKIEIVGEMSWQTWIKTGRDNIINGRY